MSDDTWRFTLVVLLLVATPLLIVAFFAFERRFPGGFIKPHQRWILFVAVALIQLALGIDHLVSGEKLWRAGVSGMLALAFAYVAIDQRRKAQGGA